jgi:hypothetical protein
MQFSVRRPRIQGIPQGEAVRCTECWYTRIVTQEISVPLINDLFLVWCQSKLKVEKKFTEISVTVYSR